MSAISNNILNRRRGDVVELGKLDVSVLSSLVERSYLLCLFKGEFGLALKASPLFNHILSIIFGCAKKEVGRIHAMPNIARMTNEYSFRNWTSEKFPRVSISRMASRFISAIFVGKENSVAISGYGAIPKPTGINLVNLVNKAFENVFAFHSHVVVMPHVTLGVNNLTTGQTE